MVCFHDLYIYLEADLGTTVKTSLLYLKGVIGINNIIFYNYLGLHVDTNSSSRL